MTVNRQWLLRSRPQGMVRESDFSLVEAPLPRPGEDEVLVRTRYLAFEPAMRGWIEDRPSYLPPVGLGEVMRGAMVGEVVESNREGLAVGDLVSGFTGWQEHCVGGANLSPIAPGVDPTLALSVLGITGVTAYFGLLDLGRPQAGETVLVSGAAGATGSVVAQIARLQGARSVGIAGGEDKCAWLRDEARLDGVIDYKGEDVAERLDALCPDGIDVYFDNVGGPLLELVLERIAERARIVLCGAISGYNLDEPAPGPRNLMNLVTRRGRMQGFIVIDYLPQAPEALGKLQAWVAEGALAWKVDVQRGFENAPATFLRLFSGQNFGKQLLELA